MEKTLKKRKYHLDFLRILAAFLIVVNHSEIVELYGSGAYSTAGSFALCWMTTLVVINIYLFYLISGALMLRKEEPNRVIYGKRIPRFLALTVLTVAFTYVFRCFPNLNAGDFFRGLFAGNMDVTHWYLYTYMGFLVMVPFLRRAVRGMTHTDAIVLVCFRALFDTLLPLARYVTTYKGWAEIPFPGSFGVPLAVIDILFYPILGYYLENVLPWEKANWKWAALSGVVIAGSSLLSTLVTMHQGLRTAFSGSYLRMNVYATAMAAFVLVKYLFLRAGELPKWFTRTLETACPLMLGVYILEPVLRPVVKPLLIGWMGPGASPIVTSLWYSFFGVVVYSAMTWLLRKLPGMKKIL